MESDWEVVVLSSDTDSVEVIGANSPARSPESCHTVSCKVESPVEFTPTKREPSPFSSR